MACRALDDFQTSPTRMDFPTFVLSGYFRVAYLIASDSLVSESFLNTWEAMISNTEVLIVRI